ncbi:transcriptional regulator of RNA polII, SAGA, subunit-domain-containing protein [Gongronella butleri]|nr:transcriptional regulator of RNA polII, SAGA, subunit-domain-containing protein [Gongronella butleri]
MTFTATTTPTSLSTPTSALSGLAGSHALKFGDLATLKTSHNGRKDVMALKQQLADCLGDNGPLYWDALRDFVMGKLNRQEFDFYANLYLSRHHAHLHNAFILSTIHNAQLDAPPPSRQRTVGWKRKRDKDGQDHDPTRQKLKLDIMSLSKADRDRIKSLVKAGDKDRLRPFITNLLAPRVSKPMSLPSVAQQVPNFQTEYSRGLLAPLCSDLKELPHAGTLKSRMNSIAMEHGLIGGVTDDTVYAMLFAMESYIKSTLSNTISKRRHNRSVGLRMLDRVPSSLTDGGNASGSTSSVKDVMMAPEATPSLNRQDLAFTLRVSPYVLVENMLGSERLTALMTDSEDEVTDDELDDSASETDFLI